jgi:hypothetical protein
MFGIDTPWHSEMYVQPADRPTEWARMAAELADTGRTIPQIADALCIDEPTTAALLEARLLEHTA